MPLPFIPVSGGAVRRRKASGRLSKPFLFGRLESRLAGARAQPACRSIGDVTHLSRLAYLLIGGLATVLAIAGAMLPGLPTTPFLLLALWAFARSSERMLSWLERLPLLRHALAEARRFEERRAIRRSVKLTAVVMAWGSVLLTALASSSVLLTGIVATAAISGTFVMLWFPTDP